MSALKKFRYVKHTADIAFVAYGKSIDEAVENAALAMMSIMFDMKKVESSKAPIRKVAIKEHAESIEELVWFALQRMLTEIQVGNLTPAGFNVKSLKGKRALVLEGSLHCKGIAASRYGLLEVKAVTPHELVVNRTKGVYRIHVVVDI